MPKKKVGRPTIKTPEMVSKILELAKKGKTKSQIAEIVGINLSTMTYWLQQDFQFFTALNEHKQYADELVEASLFRKALGFTQTYKTEKPTKDGSVIVEETQYIPPSDTAMIFWLKNRKRNQWTDTQNVNHKMLILKKEVSETLSKEELIELTKKQIEMIEGHVSDSQDE